MEVFRTCSLLSCCRIPRYEAGELLPRRGDLNCVRAFTKSAILFGFGKPTNIQPMLTRFAFLIIIPVALLCSCGSKQPEKEQAASASATGEINAALPSYSEDIQSSVKSLDLRTGETTQVPVTVKNTGPAPWASAGKAPIRLSYRWFDSQKMLPIEGERTLLPAPLQPGQSVNLQAKVVAPPSAGHFTLKICLVQEGVTWFIDAGAQALELPATVH